jgi:chromosome partitioning protein
MVPVLRRQVKDRPATQRQLVTRKIQTMKKLVVVNQKGGVGKSTVCAHLGYAGIDAGLRVLLVDLDPQGSLSASFPATGAHEGEASTSSMLFAADVVLSPEILAPGLAIIRKDPELQHISGDNKDGVKRPGRHLRTLAADYDLCIIDTPGVLGENPPMSIAGLIAADAVVCPFSVGLYEAEPLVNLWNWLRAVIQNGFNPRLKVLGLLPSKVNTASSEEMAALDNLRAQFGAQILPYNLGERAAVKQSIARHKPVWRGIRGSGHKRAAEEWKAATQYILNSLGVLK